MSGYNSYEDKHETLKRKVNTLLDDYNSKSIGLNSWEAEFLESLQSRLSADLPLSERQESKLEEVWERKYER